MASQQVTDGYAGAEGSTSQPLSSPTNLKTESGSSNGDNSNNNNNNNNNEGGSGEGGKSSCKVSRKRTKTGCLTCRKRRIKCGEERPICNNCIKSKRVCEGYNQRVVFKDGMNGLFRGPGGTMDRRYSQPYPNLQPAPGPQPLQPIAPAPPGFLRRDDHLSPLDPYSEAVRPEQSGLNVPLPSPGHPPDAEYGLHKDDRYYQPPSSATASSFNLQQPPRTTHSEPNSASLFGPRSATFTPTTYNAPPSHAAFAPSHPSAAASPTSCPFNPPLDPKYAMVSGKAGDHSHPAREFGELFDHNPASEPAGGLGVVNHPQSPEEFEHPLGIDEFMALSQEPSRDNDLDQESEDENEEDEEDVDYRIGTQEDGMIAIETTNMGTTHQQITQVLEPFSRQLDEHSMISLRSFLPDAGILANYQPMASSPLMNPTTAKIFCHFVYVLGPSMSLFERFPPIPHIAFTPGAGLHGPQNVWSYTIPMLSLQHPPLLHAILALSSLHIANLTKGPDQPSFLHYHIALRRLGKAIASDRHRGHVATLAATLMLAYYETMAAEHDKWSSHIHGAKQLLKEIDFDRVTKRVEQLDDEQGQPVVNTQSEKVPSLLAMRRMHRQMIAEDSVDDNLGAYFMGGRARRPSIAQRSGRRRDANRAFSKKELETLKLQADMFWWYTKMDCYQSLLSGCPLILDFVHWDQCPPRARIGTLGTTHGSSDHYFLLLGRLCDFQARDLERKKAVLKANGGHWIPPPELGGPPRGHRGPPPGMGGPMGMRGQPPPSPFSPDGMPFGYIPPSPHQPRMPRGFAGTLGQREPITPPTPTFDSSIDLDTATTEAIREWEEIRQALHVLQESLGPEYQPLGLEYMASQATPFGTTIIYKTFTIASLQMLYKMAMIVLYRCHPDMPPFSMMASSIQAHQTQQYAVDIARIVAGLVPTNTDSQINPALGASLIEASMPIFFAAVQFQSQEQRDWTVKKLREIHRLTGWATASRILLGIQRAWEKLAENDKGPSYVRPPFEEEAEMFQEYHNYFVSLQNGARDEAKVLAGGEEGRFLWKMAGRRMVDATGILGERDELNLNPL